ncbi:MAG TPA: hypothetical protein VK668_01955 [Mucilaginibacter sp.]|nr:hypothetical protein [Mucilaginibacter sp.]
MKKKSVFIIFEILFAVALLSCNESQNNIHRRNADTLIESKDTKNRKLTISRDSSLWYYEKVDNQTVYFKYGKKFKTNLYDLHYIGQLQANHKSPFLILSGRSCNQCDENLSIFIWSPSDGPMKSEAEQVRYSYPGKEFDYETSKLTFESKMYYGNCFLKDSDNVVWVQKNIKANGKFESKIIRVQIEVDTIKESIFNIDTLNLKTQHYNCNELPGIDVKSEP